MSEISLTHDGWVVVADGSKALFLVNEGDALYPNLKVFKDMEQAERADHDESGDKPGGRADATGDHHSAVEATDRDKVGKERFAADLCARLYKYAHAQKFKEIVLVAPPHVLGDLRQKLHAEVTECIVAEVSKDLTGHPVDRIESIVLH